LTPAREKRFPPRLSSRIFGTWRKTVTG
jgi:hypothetical protein